MLFPMTKVVVRVVVRSLVCVIPRILVTDTIFGVFIFYLSFNTIYNNFSCLLKTIVVR